MKIELKNIKITNFKGIKNLEIDFLDQTTFEGENRTGKSTVLDAVTWLLFGKNAEDKKDFSIKPLDENNNVLPKLENSVEGELFIDDKKTTLKKINREKWVKTRGESESVFTGNETIYEINGVPQKQKEYNDFINNLINEDLFKLITSTTYFNNLHWEKRREMIIELVGNIDNKDIVDKMANLEQGDIILGFLNQEYNLTTLKKEINAKIKKIKDELKLIPTRIDEAQREKPELQDFSKLKKELEDNEKKLSEIDKQLQDKSKAVEAFYNDKSEKQRELGQLREDLHGLETEHKRGYDDQYTELSEKLKDIDRAINSSSECVIPDTSYEEKISKLEETNKSLRQKWIEKNNSKFEFDESKAICPTCKQSLPNANEIKQELEENFNLDKIKSLNEIKTEGENNNIKIKEIQERINESKKEYEQADKKNKEYQDGKEKLQKQLDSLKFEPLNSKEYNDLKKKIKSKELEISTMLPIDNPIELNAQKSELRVKIDELNIKLLDADRINTIEERVIELQNDEKIKSQAIADLEKQEFAISNFEKIKMDYVEEKVNSMFSMVKFKMFKTQINEGEKPICETLINGVPFSDANTGHQVLAGLDIIKTFSNHYNVFAPIFVDNAESVTEEFPKMDSQMVYLYAVKGVKKLKIS